LIQFSKINSPFGLFGIQSNNNGITKIHLPNEKPELFLETPYKLLNNFHKIAVCELNEYFSKKRKIFDIKMDLDINPFFKIVFNEVITIQFGQTASYKTIARRINNNKAYRAVGLANKRNPVPIIIPCHRIINNNGALGGYGGGLKLKKQLLEFEAS